jgi:hypothetical protein
MDWSSTRERTGQYHALVEEGVKLLPFEGFVGGQDLSNKPASRVSTLATILNRKTLIRAVKKRQSMHFIVASSSAFRFLSASFFAKSSYLAGSRTCSNGGGMKPQLKSLLDADFASDGDIFRRSSSPYKAHTSLSLSLYSLSIFLYYRYLSPLSFLATYRTTTLFPSFAPLSLL